MKMVCPECRVGRLAALNIPYFFSVKDRPILVPAVPALVCDVCDEVKYDPEFIRNLHSLLNQESGKNPKHQQMLVASSRVWLRVRRNI
jgi:YgiT-type zinc finger domain-containing protein